MASKKDGAQLVAGKVRIVSAAYTRPANTTQYGAGDQVSDSTSSPSALTFSGVGQYDAASNKNASGVIVHAVCVDSAAQTTKAQLDLLLFRGSAAPTANNDNAAYAPADADAANVIGKIQFLDWTNMNTTAGAGGNTVSIVPNLSIAFQCSNSSEDIYGLVVERGTYTPVSGEIFTFNLHVLQD